MARTRPRPHTTLDREYLAQDTVRELGEEFGAEGPLVLLALILGAGKVTSAATPGLVEFRYKPLGKDTYTQPGRAREIVHALVPLGLLDDLEDNGERFRARLVKFPRWESVPLSDVERQANKRARDAAAAAAEAEE